MALHFSKKLWEKEFNFKTKHQQLIVHIQCDLKVRKDSIFTVLFGGTDEYILKYLKVWAKPDV